MQQQRHTAKPLSSPRIGVKEYEAGKLNKEKLTNNFAIFNDNGVPIQLIEQHSGSIGSNKMRKRIKSNHN